MTLFEMQSITKSIVSIVIGRLLQKGLLPDPQMSVATAFTPWRGTVKENITLSHLMAHTSGLDASASPEEILASGDVIKFGMALETVSVPGARFAYNNAAVNLLAALVKNITGSTLKRLAEDLLFRPLGIANWEWHNDDEGTPLVMSGCRLSPTDLAVLGRFMSQKGHWNGEEFLSSKWYSLSTAPFPPNDPGDLHSHLRNHGLLWWVLYPADNKITIDEAVIHTWLRAEPPLDSRIVGALSALAGQTYSSSVLLSRATDLLAPLTGGNRPAALNLWHNSTWRRNLPDGRRSPGTEVGFYAQGHGGQLLIVRPDRDLVIVQLVDENSRPAAVSDLLRTAEAFSERNRVV